MSILLSGDFHAGISNELSYITKKSLLRQYTDEQYASINYHIILGDAGFLWHQNKLTDIYNYKALSLRPFPILCVLGNHEPVYGRPDLPEIDIGIGEKVVLVSEKNPFIAYLKRGKVYQIDNKKFLVLGGALSIDKEYRIPYVSWWENEYWSEKEKTDLFDLLKTDNNFDYVLAHTGPIRINTIVFSGEQFLYNPKFYDEVSSLNEKIDGRITCKQWFCGHWHKDKYYYDKNFKKGYQFLYYSTALLTNDAIIIKSNLV